MKDIIRDLNNPHWWFNIIVGLLLVAIGYTITEFVIKPFGKNLLQRRKKLENEEIPEIEIAQIKENERDEMRMRFTLIYIRQAISMKILVLMASIFGVATTLLIDFWPIKVALAGLAIVTIITAIRDILKLISYQNYHFKILAKVEDNPE